MKNDVLITLKTSQRYVTPRAAVIHIASLDHILQASLGGTPGVNDYGDGSDSDYGFGDFN